MAEVASIQIKGLDEIQRRLQALPEKLRRKTIRQVLKDGTELVREEAARRAPRRQKFIKDDLLFFLLAPDMGPHLRDAVASKISVTAKGATGTVGLDYKKVHHGHLVEFGTKPHRIRIKLGGKTITLKHPGARKQPFMRPAFDAKGDDAVEQMTTDLAKAVEKEV